ncbi:MAG: 3-hydroxylacyl-ACP dehydratase [Planctomycetes bacterium]|nr:3-hydroxylacyl-ACP dehydratase [Planctomycetota bacterium]
MSAWPPLERLLPQRGPALLLDEVVAADDAAMTCRVTVREGSAYARDGVVPAVVALEYMAQAVGAWIGLGAYARAEPPRVGLLLAARDLVLHVEGFAPGDVIDVRVERTWTDGAAGAFRGVATRAGAPVAEAALTVLLGAAS